MRDGPEPQTPAFLALPMPGGLLAKQAIVAKSMNQDLRS
jgi:hypothetical protein